MSASIIVPANGEIKKYLYIPECFEPPAGLKSELVDYAAYILSTINCRLVFERLEPDMYVPLMSKLLSRVIGHRIYRRILDLLITADVIECDHSYQVGKKSKGYRLTDQYRGQPHRRHLVTNRQLLYKLKKLKKDMESAIILPTHRHLWRYLQQLELPDLPAAAFGPFTRQAQEIIDKDFRISTCQYGRVHTNLTNLDRNVRNLVRYKGLELSNIDIRNSQPLFLGLVLLNHQQKRTTAQQFNTNSQTPLTYNNQDSILSIFNKEGREDPPLCVAQFTNLVNIPDDLVKYLRLCQEGRVYEYLMEAAGVQDRDRIKKLFFVPLFGSTRDERYCKLTKVLDEHFPTVMAAVREIKRKDYRHAAALLQRTESEFVINRVVRRMMKEMPDTFVSTIHDSIVTTTDQVAAVKGIMMQEFAKLAIKPTLKTEPLLPVSTEVAA